jgi:formate dehydrogenase subunit delta
MHSKSDKLVSMVNQIARNVAIQGEDKAVVAVARHIKMFWEPRMRETIDAHVANGGSGLDTIALKALQTRVAATAAASKPAVSAKVETPKLAAKAPKPAAAKRASKS